MPRSIRKSLKKFGQKISKSTKKLASDFGLDASSSNDNSSSRAVTFSNTDEVRMYELPDENTWFGNELIEGSRDEIRSTLVELLKNQGDAYALDPEKHCLRGIEDYYMSNLTEKTTVDGVMECQRLFRRKKKFDAEQLAKVSRQHSDAARLYAHQLAIQDEKDAMYIHNDRKNNKNHELDTAEYPNKLSGFESQPIVPRETSHHKQLCHVPRVA